MKPTIAKATGVSPIGHKLAVFMFTDIADSTLLKQPSGLGAVGYATLAQTHDALFREIVSEIPGAEILKDVGDGFMATFPTASDAVVAALLFQYEIATDPAFSSKGHHIRVRIGIHEGEVSVLDPDIHGKPKLVGPAADMTARLQALALPGQILLSRAAFDNARQFVRRHPVRGASLAGACPVLHWDARGHYRFKGVEDPQEVFEVGAEGMSPNQPPPDSEKGRYVGSPDDEAMRGWRPAAGQAIPGRAGWVVATQLGEGGFGEVWLGQHVKTQERRVFKFCFDSDRLRSFRREITLFRLLREALGERPDIAKLHEFQFDKPPFLLESEYSELGDLAAWAESLGGIGKVALEQRVDLVARIAEAVSAAHSVGILHKDLKPSNILMFKSPGGAVRPRLADFGIGILIDRTRLDGHGVTLAGFTHSMLTDNQSSRTGTRLYAPPELDVGKPFTVQGDVFALGVILYQMVVGDLERPLGVGWERDVEDELLREEIRSWADRDAALRPKSASELAERLRTLGARRESRARVAAEQVARKRLEEQAAAAETRRRRMTALVVLALVLSGLTILTYLQRAEAVAQRSEAERQTGIARENEAEATKQKRAAELSTLAANRESAIADSANDFLNNQLIGSLDPDRAQGKEITVRDVVTQALSELDAHPPTESAVEQRLRLTLGQLLASMGEEEGGRDQLRRSLRLAEQLYGEQSLRVAEVLEVIGGQGDPFLTASNRNEPVESLERALLIYRALGVTDADHIARVEADLAVARKYVEGGVLSEFDPLTLGMIATARGKGESIEEVRQVSERALAQIGSLWEAGDQQGALAAVRDYTAPFEQNAIFKSRVPGFLTGMAASLHRERQLPAAEPICIAALEIAREMWKGDHSDIAFSLGGLASVLAESGRPAEAEPLMLEALEMYRRLHRGDHQSAVSGLTILARIMGQTGRISEAHPYLVEALEISRRLFGGDRIEVASAMIELADSHRALKQLTEAERLYGDAELMLRRLHEGNGEGPNTALDSELCFVLQRLAEVRGADGNWAMATPLREEALGICRGLYPGDHPILADAIRDLAYNLGAVHQTIESESLFEEAIQMKRRLGEGDDDSFAQVLYDLANLKVRMGKNAEAERLASESVSIRRRLGRKDGYGLGLSLEALSFALINLRRMPEARGAHEEAVEISFRRTPEGTPELAEMIFAFGQAAFAAGETVSALPELERALSTAEKVLPPGSERIELYRNKLLKCKAALRD